MVTLPGGVVVFTCAEWGARPPTHDFAATTPNNMVLHHMAYPNRAPIADHQLAVSKAFAIARQCQNDHMDTNGWADSGQHFTVSIDGVICEGRHGSLAALRARHCIRGAHAAQTKPFPVDDNNSWGTEHEGTYSDFEMPIPQWNASVRLHAAIAFLCSLDSDLVIGHRDTGCETDCPGNWFEAQIPTFRVDVHAAKSQLMNA